jgi:adenylyltransferase/sulfurtransferase
VCGAEATIKTPSPVEGPSHDGCMAITTDQNPDLPQLPPSCHASATDYASARASGDYLLLDVRSELQFDMCHLPGAISVPLASLNERMAAVEAAAVEKDGIYCVCRRGIDSEVAARLLHKGVREGTFGAGKIKVEQIRHVKGGLLAWGASVDDSFPSF